jgi:lipoate-protein ligase A
MRSCASSRERLRARLTGLDWRLIQDEPAPGAWNMAVDEALLEAARRDLTPPTLRLYGWSRPALSVGRHQDPRSGIDHDFRRSRGIDLVRRPTGGRAVLHHREVTYSIVLPAALGRGAGVGEVYCALSGALLAGLAAALAMRCSIPGTPQPVAWKTGDRALHSASCFATAAGGDGLADGAKLVGSAQARRGGAVLQHGSVLLEVEREAWDGLFGQAGLETGLARLSEADLTGETVRAALRCGLEGELAARFRTGILTAAERASAERLVAEQYGVGCLD